MTGKPLSESARSILIEVGMGIALYAVSGGLILCLLPIHRLPAVLAFWLGAILSFGSMVHITFVTELVLDMHNSKEAQKHTVISYLVRMFVITAVILAVYFTEYLNVVTLFIGLFGIKAGAYLQPLMHRFLGWKHKR